MYKTFKTLLFLSITTAAFALVVNTAQASILSASPATKNVNLNDTFIVDIRLDSETEIINAVETYISYSADLLQVVDLSKGSSLLTLWVEEPVADVTAGIITFVGGVPQGTYAYDGQLLRITFRAVKTGTAQIGFGLASSKVLLNDGLGTPASIAFNTGTYTIDNASPYDLMINSSSHPNEDTWYPNNKVAFSWPARAEAFYSYILTTNQFEEPDDRQETRDGSASFDNVEDGIHYFILKEKLPNDEWTLVGTRRVMIDRTAPLPFVPLISHEAVPGEIAILFNTTDAGSGLAAYHLMIDNDLYENVTSPYILRNIDSDHTIKVTAVDKAGNVSEGAVLYKTAEHKTAKNNNSLLFIIIIFVAILALISVGLYYRTKKT